MKPTTFARLLAYSEMAVGVALLAPMVPSTVAGGCADRVRCQPHGNVLQDPLHDPGRRHRSQPEGTALAKDIWLVGAGLTLLSQGIAGAAKSNAKALSKSLRKAAPFTD